MNDDAAAGNIMAEPVQPFTPDAAAAEQAGIDAAYERLANAKREIIAATADIIRGSPLKSALIALGIGFALSRSRTQR